MWALWGHSSRLETYICVVYGKVVLLRTDTKKDSCYDEIGLSAQTIDIMTTIGWAHVITKENENLHFGHL